MRSRHIAALALAGLLGAAAGVGATHVYFNRILHEIEERQREPLNLRAVDLRNTDERGTALGGPTTTFDLSTARFVGWRITFDNWLYGLQPMRYVVEADYTFPTGESYGVNDWQTVLRDQKTATFTGRVSSPNGGTFPSTVSTSGAHSSGSFGDSCSRLAVAP